MAKKFAYVCFGLLALAVAYTIAARDVVAQVGMGDVVHVYLDTEGAYPVTVAVTASGDFYGRAGTVDYSNGVVNWSVPALGWQYLGNLYSGSQSVIPMSFGGVKAKHR